MSDNAAMSQQNRSRLAAAAGLLGAMLASTCCIVPLVLVLLGASGAWIGTLTELKAYQPVFVALTVACLGFGFWAAYRRPAESCEVDESCGTPASQRLVRATLWAAAILLLLALTTDYWGPYFY